MRPAGLACCSLLYSICRTHRVTTVVTPCVWHLHWGFAGWGVGVTGPSTWHQAGEAWQGSGKRRRCGSDAGNSRQRSISCMCFKICLASSTLNTLLRARRKGFSMCFCWSNTIMQGHSPFQPFNPALHALQSCRNYSMRASNKPWQEKPFCPVAIIARTPLFRTC